MTPNSVVTRPSEFRALAYDIFLLVGLLLERLGLIGLDGSKTGGRSSLKGQIVVRRVVKACRKEKSRSIKVR